jgi:hypothetical protein
MIRTQIYLTQHERTGLSDLAKKSGATFSELVREAVNRFLAQSSAERRDAVLEATGGLWENRDDLPDFGQMRAKWDRSAQ